MALVDKILGEGMTFSKSEKEVAAASVYNVENFIMSSNAQIQKNTQHSIQTQNPPGIDLEALNKMLQTLKEGSDQLSLSTNQSSELEAEIKPLEAQIASPKPKHIVILESLHSIRNILEGAVGSALDTGVIDEILKLLQS
jgi:uridine kinase